MESVQHGQDPLPSCMMRRNYDQRLNQKIKIEDQSKLYLTVDAKS